MLWKAFRRSANVQDNRKVRTKISIGAAAVGALIGSFIMYGHNLPTSVTEQVTDVNKMAPVRFSYVDHADFIKAVLGSTEDVWKKLFIENKKFHRDAKLILFTGATGSACGAASSDIGPFLCVNKGHYILAFFNSFIIGALNLVLYKLAPDAYNTEIIAFLCGGPLGIITAMKSHAVVERLLKTKQSHSEKPTEN